MSWNGTYLRVATDQDHAIALAALIACQTRATAWAITHHREGSEPLLVACSEPAGSGLPVLEVRPVSLAAAPEILAGYAARQEAAAKAAKLDAA
jgi:hypothetical protein